MLRIQKLLTDLTTKKRVLGPILIPGLRLQVHGISIDRRWVGPNPLGEPTSYTEAVPSRVTIDCPQTVDPPRRNLIEH